MFCFLHRFWYGIGTVSVCIGNYKGRESVIERGRLGGGERERGGRRVRASPTRFLGGVQLVFKPQQGFIKEQNGSKIFSFE